MMIKKGVRRIVGWESPAAIHPGKFLEETLEDFAMSQADLAKRVGMCKKVINEIIKGKNPITRATAFKLGKVFPISEEYWINLQGIYEADNARLEEEKRIKEDTEKYLPLFSETYKELSRVGVASGLRWVESNYASITLELQRFYAAGSLEYVQREIAQVSFRKYKGENINKYSLAAWLRLGRIKAQKTEVKCFDGQKLKESLGEVVKLSKENPYQYLPKIEAILGECGVVVAYMPYLKNTHVQGAATWVGKDKALIMLNTTKKSEDRFWFTLLHEVGHILKHGRKDPFVDLESGQDVGEEEKEANEFSQKYLIPDFDKAYSDFNAYGGNKASIERVSMGLDISPSILAGRIAHEFEKRGKNAYGVLNSFFESKINYINI